MQSHIQRKDAIIVSDLVSFVYCPNRSELGITFPFQRIVELVVSAREYYQCYLL